jgi:regulatory protein YycI of two-component signal transduction system YycFG
MKNFLSLKGIMTISIMIVLILFSAIIYVFFAIKNENEKSVLLQNEIDLMVRQSRYEISLQQSLLEASTSIYKINDAILSSDQDVTFIEQLENLAKDNNLYVKIDSLSINDIPKNNSDSLTSLFARATVSGKWNSIMIFLTKLESMPFIMRVEKLSLTNSSDNPIGLPISSAQDWAAAFEIRVLQNK